MATNNKNKRAVPQWKRNAINSAIAVAFSGMVAMPAWAQVPSCANSITGAQVGCSATSSTQTIAITSTGVVSGATTGIFYGGGLLSPGVLTNEGRISASSSSLAYGVFVAGSLSGTLTNSGTISATATTSTARAYGVYVDGDLTGTLTNSGTISTTVNASDGISAYGVYVNGNLGGVLTNSGTISVTAVGTTSDAFVSAYGVYVGNVLTGTLTNNGTISVSATGDSTNVFAYGVYVNGDSTGTLTNNGSISATALNTDEDFARAYGVYVGGNLTTLTNNGTISATALDATSSAAAYGVYVNNNLSGTLTNFGAISATVNNLFSGSANAYGIYVSGGLTGTLTNSGTISATAFATSNSARAYGVYAFALDGTLNNSGTISGTVVNQPGNGYSVYIDSGIGTINNQAGGVLSGNIFVNGAVAVNNAGTISIPVGAGGFINNNYTQQSGGVLKIGATNSGNYGTLFVGGVANLTASNTIAVGVTPINTLAVGDVLQDVLATAAGSFTGLASGGTVNVIGTPLFNYTGVEDGAGSIDVTIASTNSISGVLGSLGNASLTGIGATLQGLIAGYTGTGALDPLVDAVFATNSAAELGNVVSQFVPITSTTQTTANVLHGANRIIQARQDGNKGLSSGDKFYGDRAVWLKPFGSFADQSDRNGVSGYEAKTFGVAFGADTEVSKTTRMGAAFVYARSDVKGNSSVARQNADIDSYQAILYGSYGLDDRTELSLQADFGIHENDSKRFIPAGGVTASGNFISLSSHLGVGVGRTYTLSPKTTFTPSVRADYTQIRNRGYTETGAGAFNLNVGSNTTDELILAVDGKYSHAMSDRTTFFVNLGAGYDALSEQASVTSTFVGGGAAFTTQGIDPSPWLVRGGLGAVMKGVNNMPEVTARYDIEGRQDYTNQTASIKLRWLF